jgi:hypothetical protein
VCRVRLRRWVSAWDETHATLFLGFSRFETSGPEPFPLWHRQVPKNKPVTECTELASAMLLECRAKIVVAYLHCGITNSR